MSDRAIALEQVAHFLRELRRTKRAGAMSGELALILRNRIGPKERLAGAVAFVQSIEPSDLEQLAFLLGGPAPLGEIHANSKRKQANRKNGQRGTKPKAA